MTRILIMTFLGDRHAYAVAEALRRKGESPVLWLTPDYPMRARETIEFRGRDHHIAIAGPDFETAAADFDVVWHRRPAFYLEPSLLHPSDVEFAREGCKRFREALYLLLARDAFWVNGREAAVRALHKPLQHAVAIDAGLETPDTLYTNDPQAIRAFIREHGGSIAYKPLKAWSWSDGKKIWNPVTSVLTEAELVDEGIIALSPAIYQELVPKAYELRVTVIGERMFAVKLDSQSTRSGRTDWRRGQFEMHPEATTLPAAVEERCRALMARLGLVFGCIDLIVTPDGRHVFLEVNEMGQWLFVEDWTGQPMLDAFAEMLRQGRSDYIWPEGDEHVRYADVDAVLDPMHLALARDHVEMIVAFWQEGEARGETRVDA
jgi:glutathione synthase/RimK-type ligase-like ATP-grasp enzyme